VKRILYIHHGYGIGGAPLSLLFLLQKLDREKYEPVVLCLYESAAAGLYRKEGIETYVDGAIKEFGHTTLCWYRISHPWELMQLVFRTLQLAPSIWATMRFLEEHPADLVHLNSSGLPACAIGARRAGVPVVWHIREPLAPGYFGLRRALLRRCIHKYADRVIAICENDANQLIRDKRVRVVYNFVDFDQFDRHISGDEFRSELGLNENTRLVAMLGGVSEVKGTLPFVQALKYVKEKQSDVRFLIVGHSGFADDGGGALKEKIKRLAKKLMSVAAYSQRVFKFIKQEDLEKDVVFTGVRRDIPQILAAADLLVFPSITPHFARPIIEAGAIAKPVVASDLGGPRELVRHGETGFLVPPEDPKALAEAIIEILSDDQLARRQGEAGYAQARKLFDADVNAAQTFALYDEPLGAA